MKRIGTLLLVFILVLQFVFVTGCGTGSQNEKKEEISFENSFVGSDEEQEVPQSFQEGTLIIYFADSEMSQLQSVERKYNFKDYSVVNCVRQVVHDMIDAERIIRQDEKKTWRSLIPLEMLSSYKFVPSTSEYRKGVITISLKPEYAQLSKREQVLFQTGISKTILSLNMVDGVDFIYADDLEKTVFFQAKSEQSFVINEYNEAAFSGTETVTLFFPNREGTLLVQEKREVTLGLTDSLTRAVLNALMSGPQSANLIKPIPEGTVIEDIFVKDEVCYLDFSEEFQKNYIGSESGEVLTIYSIVNSLCRLSGIKRVQFLINGKRVDVYKFSVSLSSYLSEDISLVK